MCGTSCRQISSAIFCMPITCLLPTPLRSLLPLQDAHLLHHYLYDVHPFDENHPKLTASSSKIRRLKL